MKILFSKHAEVKIRERKIKKEWIEAVLTKPQLKFYDIINKTFINIGKIETKNIETNLIVVYNKEGDIIKIVTVYPCKNIEREIKAKELKRWIKL